MDKDIGTGDLSVKWPPDTNVTIPPGGAGTSTAAAP